MEPWLARTGCLEGCVRLFATTDRTLRKRCLQLCGVVEQKELGSLRIAGRTVQVSKHCSVESFELCIDLFFFFVYSNVITLDVYISRVNRL